MEENKNSRKKTLSKVIYYVLLSFFVLVFVCSAIYIADYMIEAEQTGEEYKNLQDQYVPPSRPPITEATEPSEETGVPSTEGTESTEPAAPTEPTEPSVLPELRSFLEQNPELVGWIRIEDTDIHYPVVQSPTRPNYYLDHTFEGRSSERGAIYVREACDVFAPSDNITIYGHHMKAGNKYGTMFRDLDNYRKKDFWETHQYVYFDNLYERHTYQVFAVFKTSGNSGEGFAYHLFDDAESEEDFNEFIATVKKLSYYDTGITPQYGSKLITLSTCEYTLENGRLVVVAVRVA